MVKWAGQRGAVAHRLEQAAHNHLVVGSIPTSPTKVNGRPLVSAFYFGEFDVD